MRNQAPIISCKENHNLWAPDHAIEERLAYTRQSRKTPGKLWERLELFKFVEGMNRYWGYMKEDRRSDIQACTGIYFHIFITS